MAKQKNGVKTLTHKDILKAFGVANMTVYNWRNGTPTKAPLPYTTGDDGKLVYQLSEVAKWAKDHGVKFNPPAASEPNKQPGPVAKPKPAKNKKGAVRATGGGEFDEDPKPPIKTPTKREQQEPQQDKQEGLYAKAARGKAVSAANKSKTAQKPHKPAKQGKVHSRAA